MGISRRHGWRGARSSSLFGLRPFCLLKRARFVFFGHRLFGFQLDSFKSFYERAVCMMLFLIGDILDHPLLMAGTHANSAITLLPLEPASVQKLLGHEVRRAALHILHQLG